VVPAAPANQPERRADARMVLDNYSFAVAPSLTAGR